MIVVVCLNPAVDVTYHVDALVPGSSHRVTRHHSRAGGKGVNVARVLHQLRTPALLLGFVGGSSGSALAAEVESAGLSANWTAIEGDTRQTVTVVDSDATVLLEPGPAISDAEWQHFVSGFEVELAAAHLVVLSGSLPTGVPGDAYAQLTELARAQDVRTVVDVDGPALAAALTAKPFLAKPNAIEAASLGEDPLEATLAAGAQNAVISQGRDGLIAALDGHRYRVRGPQLAGNPTGAGDALTAALAANIVDGVAWPWALRQSAAVAAGSVALPHAGGFDSEVADRVRPQLSVEEF